MSAPQTYTSLFSDTHTHTLTPTLGTPMRPLLHTPLPSLRVWHTSLILWISVQRKSSPAGLSASTSVTLWSCYSSHTHTWVDTEAWDWKNIDLFSILDRLLQWDLPPTLHPAFPSTELQLLARECSGWGADVLPEDWASRVGGGGRRDPLSPAPLNQRVCSKQ